MPFAWLVILGWVFDPARLLLPALSPLPLLVSLVSALPLCSGLGGSSALAVRPIGGAGAGGAALAAPPALPLSVVRALWLGSSLAVVGVVLGGAALRPRPAPLLPRFRRSAWARLCLVPRLVASCRLRALATGGSSPSLLVSFVASCRA